MARQWRVCCVQIYKSAHHWRALLCRYHDEEHANLLNTMWLIAITFLSVGYGDIVPNTYCGRGIAVTTGMMVSNCILKKYYRLFRSFRTYGANKKDLYRRQGKGRRCCLAGHSVFKSWPR